MTPSIKHLPPTPGVYAIRNTLNGKVYIGQGRGKRGIRGRASNHLSLLKKGRDSRHLQAAWDKYGPEAFVFEVLALCPAEECNQLEDHFIQILDSRQREKGYNLMQGGSHGGHSDETRMKISKASKGRTLSSETREKISKTRKERGLGNPDVLKLYCGKPHTTQSRSKISKALKGRKASKQAVECLRRANLGRPLSENHRMKLSLNVKGRVWVNKAGKNKRALQEEVQILLEEGWVLGRI
jgi:group I intron endonuclease